MKKLLIIFLLCSGMAIGQQGINYKAIISDNGTVIESQQVAVSFTILEDGITTVYKERHVLNTDANGLIIANIGEGITIIGDFETINWSNAQFLQVEVDTGSGNVDLGTTAFKNVPYALHATTATTITGPIPNAGSLEKITEDTKTGYRLAGADPDFYGDIGANAIDFSIPQGESSSRGATGNMSFASGYKTTASGYSSTAMGNGTIATGDYSTAMGRISTASGESSIAIGGQSTASGRVSIAMGTTAKASGHNSIAIGAGVDASGDFSVAMGNQTTALGQASTAMGEDTTASGDYSISMGYETKALGRFSTAMGTETTAFGRASTAMGKETNALGWSSTATGRQTTASGTASTAMGEVTTAESFAQTTFGMHNTGASGHNYSFVATDRLFVLGNGQDSSNKSDAMVVLKNGNTTINGELKVNEVQDIDSGDADMKAYIYGVVDAQGSIDLASSDGFTVTKNGTGYYFVVFSNPVSSFRKYMVISSLQGSIGFVKTYRNTSSITVFTYNASGVLTDLGFNFVVYKK